MRDFIVAACVLLGVVSGCASVQPPGTNVWAFDGRSEAAASVREIHWAPDRVACDAYLLREKSRMLAVWKGSYGECRPAVVGAGSEWWVIGSGGFASGANSLALCGTLRQRSAAFVSRCTPVGVMFTETAQGQTPVHAPAAPISTLSVTPPWTPGNEWSYRWSSPRGSGTFVWVVDREEVVDGVPFYVVKSGTARESYYRKDDRAFFMDKTNGQVETRNTPPVTYWSAAPGKKEARYTRERPIERQTEEMTLTCETGALEPLTVPAGTFDAAKVTCRNSRTNAITFEMWLSPAVRHMVKERTYFSYGVRERELTSFRVQ